MAMSITKFFRRYNKHLLAVFTVFLMVVFLIPSAIRQFFSPKPTKRVIAQAYDKDIRVYEKIQTELETQILNFLNTATADNKSKSRPFNWLMFVRQSQSPILDYYLLILEAQHSGIIISNQRVDMELANRKISPEFVNRVLQSMNIPLKVLYKAVKDYLSVEEMLSLAASSIKVSEPELKHLFIQTHQRLKVNLVPVCAEKFIDKVPNPSEKEIVAHFAKNQERFRLPNRIAVEYIEADLNRIARKIKISRIRARQYWQEHKSQFTITTVPATQSTKPANQKPVKIQLPFEKALPLVIKKLQYSRAREKALTALTEARRVAESYWRKAPIDKNGIKHKPNEIADYKKLADEFSQKYGITLTYHKTKLLSPQDAYKLKGIGNSFIIEQHRPLYFPQYAFRVIPLISPPPPKLRSQILFLSLWQDSAGLLRKINNSGKEDGFYLFRVIAVDPTHLPKSLKEVKNKVIQDCKAEKAYKFAQKYAEQLLKVSRKYKLDKASEYESVDKLIKQLKIESIKPTSFAQKTVSWTGRLTWPNIPGVHLNVKHFVEECFKKLWHEPTTQPDGKFTSIIVKDDTSRCCYVVQLLEKEQPTQQDYIRIKPFLTRYLLSVKQRDFVNIWFMPDNIHKRVKFQKVLNR